MAHIPLTTVLPVYGLLLILITDICHAQDGATKTGTFDTKDECDQMCIGDHDYNCISSSHQFYCRCVNDYYSRQEMCKEECDKEYDWSMFIYGECADILKSATRGLCKYKCVYRLRLWTTVSAFLILVGAAIIVVFSLPHFIITCYVCLKMRKRSSSSSDHHHAGLQYYPSRDDFSMNGDLMGSTGEIFGRPTTNGTSNGGGAIGNGHMNVTAQSSMTPGIRSWNYPYHAYYGGKMRE